MNHPNPFAVRQLVLFASRTDPLAQWRPGIIATAGATEFIRRPTVRNDPNRYQTEADTHDDQVCDGFVYDLLPADGSPAAETTRVCACTHDLADADPSGRWQHGERITDRRQYELLWTDTGGDLQFHSASTPLEETAIVTLYKGDWSAEVDFHDLLTWAATPSGED